jgi:glycosyltransferase involved in cell wall biosynthesis
MIDPVKISVLMPVFNGEKYVAEAVDSILNQTFTDFEFIIVNDGSTDATSNILAGYDDKRIKLVSLEHEGLVYCLNKGVELSKGKYIARMDSDDIAFPERLQVQYDFMESHPEIGICGTNYKVLSNNLSKYTSRLPANDTDIRAQMFFHPVFCHPTVLLKKDVMEKSDLKYDKDFFGAEDYRLWIDVMDHTQGAIIPDILLHYRIHSMNVTVQNNKNFDSKINLLSKIQYFYMQKYGVNISQEECRIFTHFIDFNFFYNFEEEKGIQLEYVLVKILSQLPTEKNLNRKAKQYICKAVTYRAIRQKSIGYCIKSSFYRKLFVQGVLAYIKEKILH